MSSFFAFAQDLITKKDGTDIEAKILEVSNTELKYKKLDNMDGPVFTIPTSEVLIVRYSNGTNQVFQSAPTLSASKKRSGYYATDISLIEPGMKYKQLKRNYNKDDYYELINPKYSTGRAWFNLFFPGVAQLSMGEGPGYFIGGLLLSLTSAITLSVASDNGSSSSSLGYLALGSATAMLVLDIASIDNAISIAKVKSLYYDDLNRLESHYSLNVGPSIQYTQTPNGIKPALGLGVSLSF